MFPHVIIDDNIKLLNSGTDILTKINDDQYNYIETPCFTASAGKHFRHIVDHYLCFFSGLRQFNVDYDSRARETRTETDRAIAQDYMHQIIAQLKQLKITIASRHEKDAVQTIPVKLSTSRHRTSQPISSSIERELVFLHGHTTHHYAIIAAILKLQGCAIDYAFGIAPSTLAYEEQLKCAQ